MMQLGGEFLAVLREQRLYRPVLDGIERVDLTLTLDEQPERDGLHASGRNAFLTVFHRTGLAL